MLRKLCRRWMICAILAAALCVSASASELAVEDHFAYDAISNMEDGESLLTLYGEIAEGVEAMEETITLKIDGIMTEEMLMTAMEAYLADHPEHFWLSGGYRYGVGRNEGVIQPGYTMDVSEVAAAKTLFDEGVEELLEGIDPAQMTELEMELAIHDRLVERVTYLEADQSHSAYGAIVNGVAVCEGYAKAFQYLLGCVGIQSHMAVGYAGGGPHGWNLVRIDGEYYYTDVTWDDAGDQLYHAYFNITTQQLEEDHYLWDNHFVLPECTATRANYFEHFGAKFSALDVDSLSRMLWESYDDHVMTVEIYDDTEDGDVWGWYTASILTVMEKLSIRGGEVSMSGSIAGREYQLKLLTPRWEPKEGVCINDWHTWDEGEIQKEAACTKKGSIVFTCQRCEKTRTQTLDELGHRSAADEAVAPTCEETGLTAGEHCERCGEILAAQEVIPARGHDYGEWALTTSPTCTQEGEEGRSCTACKKQETRAVEAAGHDYEADVTPPTCTEQGFTTHTCTVCKDHYVDSWTDALGHDWDEGVQQENKITYTCRRCKETRNENVCPDGPEDPDEPRKPVVGGHVGGYRPVKDTKIQLRRGDEVVDETDADEDGFSFDDVEEGTYDLVVRQPGCLTYTLKGIVVEEGDFELPEIEPVAGDLDGDDKINLSDLAEFRVDFGKKSAEMANEYSDMDGDGKVNLSDLAIFRNGFGKSAKDCVYGL